jgi:hypothetical protein
MYQLVERGNLYSANSTGFGDKREENYKGRAKKIM